VAAARHVAQPIHVAGSHILLAFLLFVVGKSVVEKLMLLKESTPESEIIFTLILMYLSCAELSEKPQSIARHNHVLIFVQTAIFWEIL
jgi:hypothetical protein